MQKHDYTNFKPHHCNAERSDFLGNGEIGRYIFIPGSTDRAKQIAENYFTNLIVKENPRGHDLYLGDLERQGKIIKVAAIATGMGTPSVDLILSELIILGAKRFLRIGTAGGLQSNIQVGDVVFGTSAVRDECASSNYVPTSFPAVASTDMLIAANALQHKFDYKVHLGMLHTKDSLYAREFRFGPSAEENKDFMEKIIAYGVLATEMEAAHVYVLSQIYAHEFNYAIKSGCVLGIIGGEDPFLDSNLAQKAIDNAIDFGINLIVELANKETNNIL